MVQLFPQSAHCFQGFDFLVLAAVDVVQVEERISCDLGQQVPGKVADVAFTEVPLPEDLSWYDGLCVLMTALAKVAAQILTVPQPLDVVWIDANAAAGAAVVLFGHHHFPLWRRVDVEDDLWSGRSPLQISSHSDA